MLQLNTDETEVLVLRNKGLIDHITLNKIKIDSINIQTASSVRHLDTVFVNSIGKFTWFSWFNIRRSWRSLTTDAPKVSIKASVMSKIDYCNSVLYGIPNKQLNRIQRIENYAARVALRLHKLSHITPVLATVLTLISYDSLLIIRNIITSQVSVWTSHLSDPLLDTLNKDVMFQY